jgi:hypothetical protein
MVQHFYEQRLLRTSTIAMMHSENLEAAAIPLALGAQCVRSRLWRSIRKG